LDLDTYFRLERPAARQAYRFLDKRFYHSARLEFDLRVFACEHLGLSRAHDSAQLRRTLEPVLKELQGIGFLQPMPPEKRYVRAARGRYTVVLCRQKRSDAQKASNSAGDLASELTKRGVWADVAPDLAASLPEPEIRRYLALHDWLVHRQDKRIRKNPAGFLAACIANQLPIPNDFDQASGRGDAPVTSLTPSSRPSSKVVLGHKHDGERETIKEELSRLTEEARRELEADAVRAARPFVAATYERLKKAGGSLFEEVQHSLLVEHLKSQRLESQRIAKDSKHRDVGKAYTRSRAKGNSRTDTNKV
jgi:hypothetical protein